MSGKYLKTIILVLIILGGLLLFTDKDRSFEQTAPSDDNVAEEQRSEAGEIPDDATLTLDAAASTLTWSAERVVGGSHTGTVGLKNGSLTREGGLFIGGRFTIDMTKISESKDNSVFLGHIRSDDFFSIETYPEAKLVLTDIKASGSDGQVMSYDVEGDLTIKDRTRTITFEASAVQEASGLHVTAAFEIDRTRWGVTYDSGTIFQKIGDKAIRDNVPFELDLAFSAPQE